MFSIGIGPSSSHTVGPMRAGECFASGLAKLGLRHRVARYKVVLYGSLAATGVGHSTPDAALAGLDSLDPATCDPALVHGRYARLEAGETLRVAGVPLVLADIEFKPRVRDKGHANAMSFVALDAVGEVLKEQLFLSIGGGFIVQPGADPVQVDAPVERVVGSDYASMDELLAGLGARSLADFAREAEEALHGVDGLETGLDAIWENMKASVEIGLRTEGTLPGGLRVPRRAAALHRHLLAADEHPAESLVSAYAMAVNEQNAGGGRVVTAPTNGAAGVVPAVLYHAVQRGAGREKVHEFLLTACVIGSLIKANASISGAEGGCQAEVGSACAMAAGALTAVRGGTPAQVENAAEIALEHHLGLTCDPVAGLVQIPCIERNAVAASTALLASRMAMLGDGSHLVSLDTAIETMRQTGADMSEKYKETSTGGLAVTVPYC
ncbi:MAG: L-serine ammonia-lyase [Arthrobacter sp.]|jgi:L-serine dehydratase|nr:L-serine ammonia-lyase [Arthrobacter sp.]